MSFNTEDNLKITKKIVGMYEKDSNIAQEIFADNCVHHANGLTEEKKGPQLMIEMIQGINHQFTMSRVSLVDLLAQDNKVAFRWIWKAIDKASKKEWTFNGNTIFHFTSGKVSEVWAVDDRIREMLGHGFTITPPE